MQIECGGKVTFSLDVLSLEIISAGKNLLASGSENEGMFILSHITSFNVTKRRIRMNDAEINQILQRHQVLFLSSAIKPPSAKWQSVEMLINVGQQCFGFRHSQRNMARIDIFRVVTAL